MKALFLGFLLASPPLAAWILRGPETSLPAPQVQPAQPARNAAQLDGSLKVPVEVVAKGSAPQWVYVQVTPQAIPEPGPFALLALGSLLLLRRQRTEGK